MRRRVLDRWGWVLLVGLVLVAPVQAGETSAAGRRERFAQEARAILQRPELRGAEIGVRFHSLTSDTTLFAQGSQRPLIPASNQKVLTLAMSLAILGPEHRFRTRMLATGGVTPEGVLEGDLYLVGDGDPALQPRFFESDDESAPLHPFVNYLTSRGIVRIRGDLVVDGSVFDTETTAPGWPEDQLDRHYCAPVGGLSLNGNCLTVMVSGGDGEPSVELRPRLPQYQILSRLIRDGDPRKMSVWAQRPDAGGQVVVRGRVGSRAGAAPLRVAVRQPDWYFGSALYGSLQRAGVRIEGRLRRGLLAEARPPANALQELYTVQSPLLPALYFCGKESDNGIAEHLWKACAVARDHAGSFAGGAATARELLEGLGADTASLKLVDGSGLSRDNRMTAEAMVDLLCAMYRSRWRDFFLRSLPISGVDGSLERRMTDAKMLYRVRAKTGYLTRVSGLSGFVMAGPPEDPEVYAFSILVNGFRGRNQGMKQVQDDLCRLVVELGS